MLWFQPRDFWEWIDEIKLSLTPSPELDEDYAARREDENMDRNARRRHWEEDLNWAFFKT